jgi:hypothetical protein
MFSKFIISRLLGNLMQGILVATATARRQE